MAMQLLFVVVTLLLLAVALFALQNPDVVTVRFWPWQFQASTAAVVLGATATGALIGWLLGLVARLRRWQRGRHGALPEPPAPVTLPAEPSPPAGPPPGT
jgi:uncharacterized integral membrane protein